MSKNIICIFCTKESQATDEHVIPEFSGGSLVIKEVCKACNDKMGSDFEGPLANSIFLGLHALITEYKENQSSQLIHFLTMV